MTDHRTAADVAVDPHPLGWLFAKPTPTTEGDAS